MRRSLVASVVVLGMLLAVPTTSSAVTYCVNLNGVRICRTPGKKYDRICTTVHLSGVSITRCHRKRHHR